MRYYSNRNGSLGNQIAARGRLAGEQCEGARELDRAMLRTKIGGGTFLKVTNPEIARFPGKIHSHYPRLKASGT